MEQPNLEQEQNYPFICTYCGRPTSMPPYVDAKRHLIYTSCCYRDSCVDQWKGIPINSMLGNEGKNDRRNGLT